MYRVSGDTSYNHLGDVTENHDDLDRSYASAMSASTNNASSSSKAVLAALRALQDKIRRLEIERSQALDEAAQLKQQIKNQEAEAEHNKQKENLSAQKSLQEARHAYERLLSEKTELELRLGRLEDKNRSTHSISEDLQNKIKSLEEEKHAGALRIKDLEHQHHQLDIQIRNAMQKEKETAETMVWETKRHEEEVNSLNKRVQSLQRELSESCQEKGAIDTKLMELDRLVTQLLAVNESLVAQLSGKPAKIPSTGSKKVKKPTKPEPFAASEPTVSSSEKAVHKYSATKQSQLVPVRSEDLESLKSMHKMYAKMARSITSEGSSAVKHTKKSSSGTDVSMTSNKSAGSAKKGAATRVSRKKAALLNKFAEESNSRSHVNTNNASSSFVSSGMHSMNVHLPKPSISFDGTSNNHSRLDDSVEYESDTAKDYQQYLLNRSTSTAVNSSTLDAAGIAAPSSILKNSNSARNSHDFAEKTDIKNVISALEEEFDALNLQYRRLLSNVQTPAENHPTTVGVASAAAGSAEVNGDAIQAQAEEIVSVIQKLHKKGEQLRALKSP